MNKDRKLNKLLITGIIIFTLIFSYTTTGINNVKEESYIDKLNIIKSSSDGLPY